MSGIDLIGYFYANCLLFAVFYDGFRCNMVYFIFLQCHII